MEEISLRISRILLRIMHIIFFQQCLIETVEKVIFIFFTLLKMNGAAISSQGVCACVCFQHTYTSTVSCAICACMLISQNMFLQVRFVSDTI